MADTVKYVAAAAKKLSASITATDTTIALSDVNGRDGTALTMTDFGSIGYATIEPNGDNMEFISFTGISSTSLTGVTRGLKFEADYTADSSLRKAHSGGVSLVFSNSPQFYDEFVAKDNDETISGAYTFTGDSPANSSLTKTATSAGEYITKYHFDTNGGNTSNFDQLLCAGTAGETVAAGNLVYFDDTDNEWKKTDADTAASVNNVLLGIAQGAGTDGASISGGVLLAGLDNNQSSMTAGDIMYASNTAGGISSSAGTTEVVIGIARTTTSLYFMPRFNRTLTEAQFDLIAAITASATEINLIDGYTGTTADLNEMSAIVQATNITGSELETLSASTTSNADSLHTHSGLDDKIGLNIPATYFSYVPQIETALWTMTDATFTSTTGGIVHRLDATAATFAAISPIPAASGSTNQNHLWSVSKDYEFEVRAQIPTLTGDHGIGFFESGGAESAYNHTANHIAFMSDGATMYATCANGITATTTDISSGLTLTNYLVYKCVVNPGVDAKFYVGGTLKATLTTNLPTAANAIFFGMGGQTDTEDIYFHGLRFRQEL